MNTQANAATQSGIQSQAIAPAAISASRLFYWSVRRELWENRWIYLAPLTIGGLFLFGFLITAFRLPVRMRAAMALGVALLPWAPGCGRLLLQGVGQSATAFRRLPAHRRRSGRRFRRHRRGMRQAHVRRQRRRGRGRQQAWEQPQR